MRRRARATAERATDRQLAAVAAVVVAGSDEAAADRLGPSHSSVKHHLANARSKVGATTTAQLVWILAPRLPEAVREVTLGEESADALHPQVGPERPTQVTVSSAD
jgi:DNA-binding CsgD family transcriptional regulator